MPSDAIRVSTVRRMSLAVNGSPSPPSAFPIRETARLSVPRSISFDPPVVLNRKPVGLMIAMALKIPSTLDDTGSRWTRAAPRPLPSRSSTVDPLRSGARQDSEAHRWCTLGVSLALRYMHRSVAPCPFNGCPFRSASAVPKAGQYAFALFRIKQPPTCQASLVLNQDSNPTFRTPPSGSLMWTFSPSMPVSTTT